MIIRQFLEWFTASEMEERIEAAMSFCEAYTLRVPDLYQHPDVEVALSVILDDPNVNVRRVLVEFLAGCEFAPRHIIIGLAQDVSEIAVPVIARSLILNDADLIDCIAIGDDAIQIAISMRGDLPFSITSALSDVACLRALYFLLRNESAKIAPLCFARMIERFSSDVELRNLLLQRNDLPIAVRYALVIQISRDLMVFAHSFGVDETERTRRLIKEANEKTTINLEAELTSDESLELVETLRVRSHLTPSLLLRSLLSNQVQLFESTLAVLSSIPIDRVCALLRQKYGTGFSAVYLKANMPKLLETAFKTAYHTTLENRNQFDAEHTQPVLSRTTIQRVLIAVAHEENADARFIVALLHRLESEAAREDAREFSTRILQEPAPLLIDLENNNPSLLVDYTSLEKELADFVELAHQDAHKAHTIGEEDKVISDNNYIENEIITYRRAA